MAERSGGILLDSSVAIAHMRGRLDLREKAPPEEPLFLPLTSLGELYKGAFVSARPEKNLQQIEELLGIVAVLTPDQATARKYGEVAAALEKVGATIPENDMWIAAVALECDLPLAARDAHFQRVPGLTVLDWS